MLVTEERPRTVDVSQSDNKEARRACEAGALQFSGVVESL